MTGALVTLSVAMVSLVPALIYFAYQSHATHKVAEKALRETAAAVDLRHKEAEMCEEYLRQRDALQRDRDGLADINRALKARLYQTELALNRAEKDFADAVRERAKSGDAGVAAHELDRLLQSPILETDAQAAARDNRSAP